MSLLSDTELAKNIVQQLLFNKLIKTNLPKDISEFLVSHWQQYLTLTYLKQGEDSTDWIEASQLIDDLIWAAQNHTDEKSIVRGISRGTMSLCPNKFAVDIKVCCIVSIQRHGDVGPRV